MGLKLIFVTVHYGSISYYKRKIIVPIKKFKIPKSINKTYYNHRHISLWTALR